MLLRVRVTSFLSGFGLASLAAFWQLRNDITASSEFLASQAQQARDDLDRRVAALEAIVLPPPAAAAAVAAPAAPAAEAAQPVVAAVVEELMPPSAGGDS